MHAVFVWLVTGEDGRWRPGIGDPTFVGWLTVVAYVAAAGFAFRAFLASRGAARHAGLPADAADARALARLWLLVTAVMLLLGLNKQLDVQTLFTQVARDMALAQGWYEERRKYQLAFIVAILAAGAVGTGALAFALRRVLGRVVGAVVGLGLIASFVVVRAASFHHVDILLGTGPVRLNWVLELGGIAAIAVSASRGAAHAPR